VYVTHDPVEAMTMGDRVAVLVDGRIQQIGGPRDVYDRPDNLVVARFLGSPAMNTLPGTFEAVGDHVRVRTAAGSISVDMGVVTRGTVAGRGVVVGFRAEDAGLGPPVSDRDTADQFDAFAATVRIVEHHGVDDLVVCDVGPPGAAGASDVAGASDDAGALGADEVVVRVRSGTGTSVHVGDRVRVCPGRVHLFDADTGRRIE
jgi:multiple sugar transport system ATP-binding protein